MSCQQEDLAHAVKNMLTKFGSQRYIANLGHGMHPDHDPEKLATFIDTVHSYSETMNERKWFFLAMTLYDIYINCSKVIPELITSKFYWKETLVSMLLQNYLIFLLQWDEKWWEISRKNLELLFTLQPYHQ